MLKLYKNFHIFHFQQRIVSWETIRGNMVCYFDPKSDAIRIIFKGKPGNLVYPRKVASINFSSYESRYQIYLS